MLRAGNDTATVRLGNGAELRWRIDTLTTQSILLGTYEPYMQAALAKFLRPGAVFFDIGAHAGFHSFFAATLVGKTGRVIAFEPNPSAQESIGRQIAANPRCPVTLLPYALLDRCEKAQFATESISAAQAHINPNGDISVQCRTLDSCIADRLAPVPSVIKIDVEGAEQFVLAGAMDTIRDHHPVVLCDYNDDSTLDVVRKMLGPLGYSVASGPPVIATPADR
jgi:FkbM family methyltransferase